MNTLVVWAICFVALLVFRPVNAEEKSSISNINNWELYGSARVGGAWWDRQKWYNWEEVFDINGNVDTVFLQDSVPVKRLFTDLQYNSRFGARAKSEMLGFRFELGWTQTVHSVNIGDIQLGSRPAVEQRKREALRLRLLYGEWFINDMMTVTVGQDWTLSNFGISNQIFFYDAGLSYVGALSTGRKPLVKFGVHDHSNPLMDWKAELAVIKTDTAIIPLENDTDAEEKRPKVEIGGQLNSKFHDLVGIRTQAVAGYTRYDLVIYPDVTSGISNRKHLEAHVAGGVFGLDVWKASLDVTYTLGKNLGPYGMWFGDPDASRLAGNIDVFYPEFGTRVGDTTGVQYLNDVNTTMGAIVFKIFPLKWIGWEIGTGWIDGDTDSQRRTDESNTWTNQFKRSAWYTNLQIRLADGHFLIVPEYSFSDLGGGNDPSQGAGKWKAYGLKLQIDFD